MKFSNRLALVVAPLVALTAGVAKAGTPTVDLTPITGAFTASDVTTGVMAVAAVLAVIFVSIRAAKIVLSMVRGG
jgi:hypothetical protein